MAAVLFAPAAPELPSTPEAGQGGAPGLELTSSSALDLPRIKL